MAWLLTYDVTDPVRLQRIHRRMLNHATPLQYSVFWLQGGTGARNACLADVLPHLKADADDLRAYEMPQRGLRLRLGVPTLPEGIVWNAAPAAGWNNRLEATGLDGDGARLDGPGGLRRVADTMKEWQ